MENFRDELVSEYRKNGGWQSLKGNYRRWEEILESDFKKREFNRRDYPPPPPSHEFKTKAFESKNRKMRPSRPPGHPPGLARGLAVFDSNK
jgi:hypothetical protein